MSDRTLQTTRQSLHAVAEYLLAGPQYAGSGDIRLRVTDRGFATVGSPELAVEADDVVTGETRVPIRGTVSELAAQVGVEARDLRDVYADGPAVGVDGELAVDVSAARLLLACFARGDAALRLLAPGVEPVLWPEHFDVAVAFDEVNYGVSPGDSDTPEPYAYVGPWRRRTGPFWNAPFGALRPMSELPGVDDVLEFFAAGGAHASDDPEAT